MIQTCIEIAEKIVRVIAIICISAMEYQLIVTGEDGIFLLPVAFVVGLLAGLKVKDLKEFITKNN